MNTITTLSNHQMSEGEKIALTRPDFRWWRRLWHFVTFREMPVIVDYFVISSVENGTTFTVKK